MKIEFNNFIQIAGVIDINEAELLINCGAEYLGFPLRLPVNKEDHTEEEAAEIIQNIGRRAVPILITYLKEHSEIIKFAEKLKINCIQLHGDILPEELVMLKTKSPNLSIIKSLIVRNNNFEELKKEILQLEPFVDAFITDTFDPVTGATGATGKIHNWQVSKEIVETANRPVILAGGLNSDNVKDAILTVKPAGVDVHTGVELNNGRKNKFLVEEFIKNAKIAFNKIEN